MLPARPAQCHRVRPGGDRLASVARMERSGLWVFPPRGPRIPLRAIQTKSRYAVVNERTRGHRHRIGNGGFCGLAWQ